MGMYASVRGWIELDHKQRRQREQALPRIRAQIERLASLPPVDDDGDRPRGLFLVTDERGNAGRWELQEGLGFTGQRRALRPFSRRDLLEASREVVNGRGREFGPLRDVRDEVADVTGVLGEGRKVVPLLPFGETFGVRRLGHR
jgi:hypothetical protein